MEYSNGVVVALSKSEAHTLRKYNCDSLYLIKDYGVKGDTHAGKTVKHRSRVRKNPHAPNLRQVHLIQQELFPELREKGFSIGPGEMGENITTYGIDLLSLSKNTILNIGETACIRITGLRNPCNQLNTIQRGLMQAVLDKDNQGNLIRKAGVMGVVLESGVISIADAIVVTLPDVFVRLERV